MKQLEIELKQTLITKSLVEQIIYVYLDDYYKLEKHEILGWFMGNNFNRVVISYKDGLLTQSQYIEKTEDLQVILITEENINIFFDSYFFSLREDELKSNIGKYLVKINDKNYTFETDIEANSFCDFYSDYQSKVEEKGQFYIL